MISAKKNRAVQVASTILLVQLLQTQILQAPLCSGILSIPAASAAEPAMVLKGAYNDGDQSAATTTTTTTTTTAAPESNSASSTTESSSTETTTGEDTKTEATTSQTTSKTSKVDDKDKKLETGISVSTHMPLKTDGKAGNASSKLKCVEFAPSKDPFEEAINTAAITAMERDPEVLQADQNLFKMQGSGQSAKEMSKNFLHYLLNYRGVGPSSAGANALMERKIKASSTLSAELKWEKAVDEKYVSTVNACAELADALDREDAADRAQALSDAKANLNLLVGEEETNKLVDKFQNLKATLPATLPNPGSLGVAAERARIRTLEEAVIKQDPILSATAQKLAKYTVTTKTEVVTGAVQTALGVAGLAPSLIGPCAQLVKTAFILSTGGSEENKLYKEVFLFKRIEVRARTISQLSSTAVRSYHMACMTKRPLLAAYAQSLMSKMTDADTVSKIVSGNLDTRLAVPVNAATASLEAKAAMIEAKNTAKATAKGEETKPDASKEASKVETKADAAAVGETKPETVKAEGVTLESTKESPTAATTTAQAATSNQTDSQQLAEKPAVKADETEAKSWDNKQTQD
ncbi:MAG: hypothetical protein LCH63_05155 [Candidatus Melainabacteria bacterium]|nr:hypothetical protein [Candidatus Melainabacteria bacterium]